MSVEVTQLLIEYCHLVMLPVYPDKVNRVLLIPEHTVAEPATEPPTEAGATVMMASVELAGEQIPLVTTALYFVVNIRLIAVYVAVVLAMSVEVSQLSVEYCHLVMLPV